MFWNAWGDIGRAALTYTGLFVLPEVASAVGRGLAGAIETVLPPSAASRSYNNPSHLGSHVDTRA